MTGRRLQRHCSRSALRAVQPKFRYPDYAYRTLVWDIYVERIARPTTGAATDEAKVAAALPKAEICLSAISTLMDEAPWLVGPSISLADLHAAPMFAAFRLAPEGERLLARHERLVRWWEQMSARPSFVRTRVPPRHASLPVGAV